MLALLIAVAQTAAAQAPDPDLNLYDLDRVEVLARLVYPMALTFLHLGRPIQDFQVWSSFEVGQLYVPSALVQISSIMPQKRNPDVFELVRGTQATALGALQEILGITTKLPSGYHRDLQRLKAPLFASNTMIR